MCPQENFRGRRAPADLHQHPVCRHRHRSMAGGASQVRGPRPVGGRPVALGVGRGHTHGPDGIHAALTMTIVSPSSRRRPRAALGADAAPDPTRRAAGLQIDKTCAVGHLDFNSMLAVGPDRSIPQGLLTAIREITEACRAENASFALASETWWDRLLQWAEVSYLRLPGLDATSPALRYTFPEWTCTVFAENPGDFIQLNNGMRYGLVWAMAARHYNDSVEERLTRPLTRYLRELIRIRIEKGARGRCSSRSVPRHAWRDRARRRKERETLGVPEHGRRSKGVRCRQSRRPPHCRHNRLARRKEESYGRSLPAIPPRPPCDVAGAPPAPGAHLRGDRGR